MRQGTRQAIRGGVVGVPPCLPREACPQGGGRTVEALHPALDEFLKAVAMMAADVVLAKLRETKGLDPASIKCPRGTHRTGEPQGSGENRSRFAKANGPVQIQRIGGSGGR